MTRLGELASEHGVEIRIVVVGGAAMALGYNARGSTRDVDVYIVHPEPARIARELSKVVAHELNLAEAWLNDGAKGYLHGTSQGIEIFRARGIVANMPSTEQLLAMKLCAWRDEIDIGDARRLLLHIKRSKHDRIQIWNQVEKFLLPGRELKAKYAFSDLWEENND